MNKAFIYSGKWLLMLCASFCTLGALISAFGFSADMTKLLLILSIAAAAVTALTERFRGMGVLIAPVPALLLFVPDYKRIAAGFRQAAYSISLRYSEWLPVPVLFSEENEAREALDVPAQVLAWAGEQSPQQAAARASEAEYFFAALGVAVIIALGAGICLKRSTLLTVLPTLPFVLLTFILRSTAAGAVYLLGLIAVYLAVFMSGAIYPDDFSKSAKALVPVFLVSVIFTGIIYIASPPAKYQRAGYVERVGYFISSMSERVIVIFSDVFSERPYPEDSWLRFMGKDVWMFNTEKINIAGAGERVITDRQLLEIQASRMGTFYLRGFSMKDFDGKAWTSDVPAGYQPPADKAAQEMPAAIASAYINALGGERDAGMPPAPPVAGINIRKVSDITEVAYKPYYTGDLFIGRDMVISGYDSHFFYMPGSVRVFKEAMALPSQMEEGESPGELFDTYTRIGETTAEGLRQMMLDAGIDPDAEREVIADAVASYIKSVAAYTLTPPVIPEGEDFALYFLQTSRQGYCIHFATAATLMLRALDIPARYTSGYFTTVSRTDAGSSVALTDRNAHAWVEVLYDDAGWLPLEVTPSTRSSGIPPAQPHTPPEPADSDASEQPVPAPEPVPDTGALAAPGTGGGQNAREGYTFHMLLVHAGRFMGVAVLLILTLVTRYHALRLIRTRRFMQKDRNTAVICMWKYAQRLCRGQAVMPTDIEDIALKARFSRHRITEEERSYMLAYTRRLALELYDSKEEYGRILFRYIRGMG